MRQWLMCLALLLGACTSLRRGSFSYEDILGTRTCREGETSWPDVFPKHALSFELGPEFSVKFHDERVRLLNHCWNSGVMQMLREGPLFPAVPGSEVYRFTWMRSFNDYVVIRVEHLGPIHSLHVKVRALYGHAWVTDRRILLTPGQWQELRHRVEQARFWSDNRFRLEQEVIEYADGATWLFEGVRGGSYHALDVHSPDPEGPAGAFRAACLYMVELSGLSIPAGDVY